MNGREQARHSRLVVTNVQVLPPAPGGADERRWELAVDDGTTVEAYMPASQANAMAVHAQANGSDELRWVADEVKRAVREAPNRATATAEVLLLDPLELRWPG